MAGDSIDLPGDAIEQPPAGLAFLDVNQVNIGQDAEQRAGVAFGYPDRNVTARLAEQGLPVGGGPFGAGENGVQIMRREHTQGVTAGG